MIRKLFLCVAIVLSGLGFVQAQQSNLVVFSDFNQPFTLLVNGQRVNQMPNQNIKVTGLQPGWYTLRLVFNNPTIPQTEMSLAIEADREVTYAMVRDAAGRRTLMFVNEFTLGYNPIPQGQQFVVGYNGPVNSNPNSVVPVFADDPVIVGGGSVIVNDPPVSSTQTTTTTTIITNDPGLVVGHPTDPVLPPNPLPGYNGPVGCQTIMDNQAFGDAKSSISSKSFSSSKMTLAKQITRANCLLSRQVREVMDLFDYETDRLNYAKFAYDYTYDQGNFYMVNDAFDFESSIRSLEEFLNGR